MAMANAGLTILRRSNHIVRGRSPMALRVALTGITNASPTHSRNGQLCNVT